MKYTIDKKESYTTFTLQEPKLNSLVAPELKTELILMGNEGTRNIILDMSEVEFVDSSGLSAILVGHRLCTNKQGLLTVCQLHPNVDRLIKISQLDNVLHIFPTIQEAKDYTMMRELEREMNSDGDGNSPENETEDDRETGNNGKVVE